MSTIFDKILSGEIPCEKVYEDEHVFAFNDIQPVAPIHILVIPKHKLETFDELADADPMVIESLFRGAAKIARTLNLPANGYRIVVNNGKSAGQTVDYIHVHLISGRDLQWPPG